MAETSNAGILRYAMLGIAPMQGWQCGCGTWVPNGVSHQCPTAPRWVDPPGLRLSDEEVERIARRVAEILKERP